LRDAATQYQASGPSVGKKKMPTIRPRGWLRCFVSVNHHGDRYCHTPAVVFFSAELQSNLVTRSFLSRLGYDSSSALLTLSITAQCTEYLAFTTVDDFYVVDENDFDALLGVPWVESCHKKNGMLLSYID